MSIAITEEVMQKIEADAIQSAKEFIDERLNEDFDVDTSDVVDFATLMEQETTYNSVLVEGEETLISVWQSLEEDIETDLRYELGKLFNIDERVQRIINMLENDCDLNEYIKQTADEIRLENESAE